MRGEKRFKLSENAKTALLTVISTLLFFVLVLQVYKKAGSDAYKKHGSFDSYTLQALAWRKGEAKLDKNYPHLELAIINRGWLASHDKRDFMAYRETFGDVNAPIQHVEGNEYYVSFPPVPSVPMLILSFFTGADTPDNFMSVLYVVGAFAFAILIGRRLGYGCIASLAGGLLSCAASGAFFLCANKFAGGPWFAAQTLSMLLTMAAFFCMLSKRDLGLYMAFALLALAVGCRPFQIVYFVLLAYVAAKKYDFKVLKTWKFYIAPALIGGTYMWYNYIRFGSVFEFGHNYLPEFMRAEYSQFSLNYVKDNYKIYFKTLPYYKDGQLEFSRYGFTFWVANVIFILAALAMLLAAVYFVRMLIRRWQDKKARGGAEALSLPGDGLGTRGFSVFRDTGLVEAVILALAGSAVIFLLLMHRTAGGWQFGNRYTVDVVPAALLLVGYCLRPFAGIVPVTGVDNANSEKKSGKKRRVLFGSEFTRVPVTDGYLLIARGAVILLAIQLILFGTWLNIHGAYLLFK
ncbi:MAG: hypothetical protein IKI42_02505 [Clostridia bacterium]|nr:hypothetical protein [Clostridia bacterium]